MRVLISGYTGLVGTEVAKQLRAAGHEAIKLERDEPNVLALIESVDAVVNLAGATTGKIPWTKKYKQEIVSSRIETTKRIVDAINGAKSKPSVLVSGSASGSARDPRPIT
jgi:NAD dependent epimerase/dehydratase family enzyme